MRGGSDQCAVLVAAPDLLTTWGPLFVWSTNNVTLEHLVIDGNREARTSSPAARLCLKGQNVFGFNATFLDCLNCGLDDVVSTQCAVRDRHALERRAGDDSAQRVPRQR